MTFLVYTALGGALSADLQLQQSLGWSALAAGVSLLPFTVLMLLRPAIPTLLERTTS